MGRRERRAEMKHLGTEQESKVCDWETKSGNWMEQ